jgi:hypothetical protein
MAALVTANLGTWRKLSGIVYAGPTLVANASETDLSTPDTSIEFETIGVRRVSIQVVFANYTSVTVKAQRSLDGGDTWNDITDATASTNGTVYDFAPEAPLIRLSIAGTLSGSADTMEVWAYMER